jgi:hypothetical protein
MTWSLSSISQPRLLEVLDHPDGEHLPGIVRRVH